CCRLSPLLFTTPSDPTTLYTPSLHDALPDLFRDKELKNLNDEYQRLTTDLANLQEQLSEKLGIPLPSLKKSASESEASVDPVERSEEHTSELQSRENLVCRLLLEKKKTKSRK